MGKQTWPDVIASHHIYSFRLNSLIKFAKNIFISAILPRLGWLEWLGMAYAETVG
jgi:hypothetical protein